MQAEAAARTPLLDFEARIRQEHGIVAREEQEPDRHRDHCGNHNGDSHRVESSDGPCAPAIARQLVCLRLRTASVSISR